MALIYGKYVARIPKLPNILALPLVSILGGFCASRPFARLFDFDETNLTFSFLSIAFGLLAFPFLRPLHNRKKAMHNLMMSRDSFVAAKARKLCGSPLFLPFYIDFFESS